MFILDAHLDLSMNAMEWNRDLTKSVAHIRERERGMTDKPDRGGNLVSLPALRQGNIGLVVATQIARYVAPGNPRPGWHSPEQAWAQTQGQLAWYRAMEAAGEMIQVRDLAGLDRQLRQWKTDPAGQPIGYILSLEGADSLISPDYLDIAWACGLRAVGPAHYGPGRYANGTSSSGKMNQEGIVLLHKMESLGLILDATHLCDDAFWQAMDIYQGPVWASHNNCRALVPGDRQFSDDQVKTLIAKKAVIGCAFDAWMLVPGWQRGSSTPSAANCTLDSVINHIDHICQLAGNTLHAGLGTDLDGAFGKEQCPADIDSIADLRLLEHLLRRRGYGTADIENILHGNFIRFLRAAWS